MNSLSPQTYHQDLSHISKSGLDLINKSPRHYWWKYLSGQYSAEKEALHYRIGTAFHVATTEPHLFWERYAIAPNKRRNTIDGREEWERFETESAGKVVLKAADKSTKSQILSYDQIMFMRDSVMSHPVANTLLKSGKAEQIFTWIDPGTGAPCKCMLDWINSDGFIVDLKSTKDASPKKFARSVVDYRYFVQDPFYLDGYEIATGTKPKGFVFIAVEKVPPYCVECYFLDSEWLDFGREKYKLDLAKYMECRETGNWHGYTKHKLSKLEL